MSSDNATRKVRTTFQPDVELEVDAAEYLDLERQGLLVEDDKNKAGRKATEKQEG